MTLTRRDFLSASAAFAACRRSAGARGRAPLPREADVVVIGAGAAGIAAARRIMAANRKVIVIEASTQIGGRCHHRQHDLRHAVRSWRALALRSRHQPDGQARAQCRARRLRAPPGQKIRIGRRNARAGETEEFLAALVRANRAIDDASRGKADMPCAAVLPKDLGDWAATAEFVLGANATGKDLKDISAIDRAHAQDRTDAIGCRQGLGTLIARSATICRWRCRRRQTASPGTAATSRSTRRRAGSPRAPSSSRCRPMCWPRAISNSRPILPKRQLDAASKLCLGSYDRIAL